MNATPGPDSLEASALEASALEASEDRDLDVRGTIDPVQTKRIFALLWVPYALLTLRFWWVCDDAFISFRYARNWAHGEGLRFNLGEHVPVEGYSNFLWVAVAASMERLGLDVTLWPAVLSFLLGTLLLARVVDTLRNRFRTGHVTTLLGGALLALAPPFAVWSTSGLETVPFALALFVAFERLILRRAAAAPVAAGLAAIALSLLRVEGIWWAAVLVPLTLVSRRLAGQSALRPVATYLGLVVVGYGSYWLWRYSYYELPFSNTTYAKVAMSAATLERGWAYVAGHLLALPGFLALVPALLLGVRRSRWHPWLALVAMGAGPWAFAALVSGDFMPMGRLLVPSLPFLAVLLGWTLEVFAGRGSPVLRRGLLGAAIALVVAGHLPAWNVHVVPETVRQRFRFRGAESKEFLSEYEQWVRIQEGTPRQTQKGKALGLWGRPTDSLVTGAVGAVGYYSGLFVYDQNGLVTRSVTERDTRGEPLRKPGHDKHVSESFFLDQKPTVFESRVLARERLEPAMREWSNQALSRRYAPEFLRLPEDLATPGREYLLVLRRLEPGTDHRRAWDEAFEAVARLDE